MTFNSKTSRMHLVGLSCNSLPPKNYGGIELVITNLAKGFVAAGLDVYCYCPAPFRIDGATHIQTLDAPTEGPKQGVTKANTKEHLDRAFNALQEHYREGDIVHLHHPEHWRYLLMRKPFQTVFGKKKTYAETAHWLKVGMGKNIIYPSQGLKDHIGKPGIVIPHPVDLTRFYKNDEDKAKAPFLFYPGVIARRKGVHMAVEAVKDLGMNIKIAGPILDKEYAQDFIDERCVTYLGDLPDHELRSYYATAEAVIYMSQYLEPFGLVPVEAMACGCPVITSGQGGTGETVVDGKTGFICETVEEIKDAIRKLDTIDRVDCINRANDYDIAHIADRYISHYNSLYA